MCYHKSIQIHSKGWVNMKHSLISRLIVVFLCVAAFLFPLNAVHAEEAKEETTEEQVEENIRHESDENNSLENADPLEVGVMMVGRLTDRKDVDCFQIDTTSTGDILVNFNHEADGIYAYYWYMDVVDSENNSLLSGTLSGKEATDFSITTVKPGTYYFKVSAISGGNPLTNGFTDAPYMMTVTTKCLNHPELTDWVVTKEYSCSMDGERTKFCVACNTAVVVEPVKQLEHTYTDWSVIDEAAFFKPGTQRQTCTACGDVVEKTYFTETTIGTVICAVVLVIIIIIVCKVSSSRSRKRSRSSYSSGRSYSSGGSGGYSGSSGGGYSGGGYSGSYGGDSYGGSSYDDYNYSRPADGVVHMGGESHNVYMSDAEGYSSAPYIEDAEGYKTYVDPASVEPPFNWCDL